MIKQSKNLCDGFHEANNHSVLCSACSQWRRVPAEPDFIWQNGPWKYPNPYTDFWKFNHSSEEVLIWLKIDVCIINIYIWDSCEK